MPQGCRIFFSCGQGTGDISELPVKVAVSQKNCAESMDWKFVLAIGSRISLFQLVLHLMLRLSKFFPRVRTRVVPGSSSRFTSVISQPIVNPMSGKIVAEARVKNRVRGHAKRTGETEKGVQKENCGLTRKGNEAAILLRDAGERFGNIVLSTSTTT